MSAGATMLPENATHQQTSTFNQQLVMRAVHDHRPLSRANLARRIACERTASPLDQAALGDATIELSPTETPGARGSAAIARHRIGLPEREGVGER